jgi:hypothetical protein
MHHSRRYGDMSDVSVKGGGMHICSKSAEEEEAKSGDRGEQSGGKQITVCFVYAQAKNILTVLL